MDDKLTDIKVRITQLSSDGWDAFAEILYQHYVDTETDSGRPVREAYDVLENHTRGLPFSVQDKILCAAIAMCVEYEHAAFSAGLLTGARLILDLSETKT